MLTLSLDTPVLRLPLSVRARNALHNAGKQTLADVVVLSRYDLAKMKNVGTATRTEVHELLLDLGYDFAPSHLDEVLTVELEVERLLGRIGRLDGERFAALLWKIGHRKVAGPWERVPDGAVRRILGSKGDAGIVHIEGDRFKCGEGTFFDTQAEAREHIDDGLSAAGWLLAP